MKKKLPLLTALLLGLGLFFLLQALLTPKYMTSIREGALIGEYYHETTDHDVLFVGDCELYENISPVTLWEEYGITSYIRGSSQQLIWQSYYLLEEALQRETPEVVVFNVLSMKYGEPQSEAYNRMSIDQMKLSLPKLRNIRASMTEEETLLSYLFPLLRYHSRWSELTEEDFTYWLHRDKVSHNGYLMRVDSRPATAFPAPKPLADYQFAQTCYDYLDKMTRLCQEKGIALVLVKAPCLYPHWYEEWERQITDYAVAHDLPYYNFLEVTEDIGIDMVHDTYDSGLHLNNDGAEKLSIYFGGILSRELGVPDRSGDSALAAVWREKSAFYHTMKQDQYRELEEFGYLKSYGARPAA